MGDAEHPSSQCSYEDVQIELIDDEGKEVAPAKESGLDKEALKVVQESGYPRDYIIDCLRSDKCNHVTAFYYLMTS